MLLLIKLLNVSNSSRAVIAGGSNSTDSMEFVTIASTGNGTDFGDLVNAGSDKSGASNAHGGLA